MRQRDLRRQTPMRAEPALLRDRQTGKHPSLVLVLRWLPDRGLRQASHPYPQSGPSFRHRSARQQEQHRFRVSARPIRRVQARLLEAPPYRVLGPNLRRRAVPRRASPPYRVRVPMLPLDLEQAAQQALRRRRVPGLPLSRRRAASELGRASRARACLSSREQAAQPASARFLAPRRSSFPPMAMQRVRRQSAGQVQPLSARQARLPVKRRRRRKGLPWRQGPGLQQALPSFQASAPSLRDRQRERPQGPHRRPALAQASRSASALQTGLRPSSAEVR